MFVEAENPDEWEGGVRPAVLYTWRVDPEIALLSFTGCGVPVYEGLCLKYRLIKGVLSDGDGDVIKYNRVIEMGCELVGDQDNEREQMIEDGVSYLSESSDDNDDKPNVLNAEDE